MSRLLSVLALYTGRTTSKARASADTLIAGLRAGQFSHLRTTVALPTSFGLGTKMIQYLLPELPPHLLGGLARQSQPLGVRRDILSVIRRGPLYYKRLRWFSFVQWEGLLFESWESRLCKGLFHCLDSSRLWELVSETHPNNGKLNCAVLFFQLGGCV